MSGLPAEEHAGRDQGDVHRQQHVGHQHDVLAAIAVGESGREGAIRAAGTSWISATTPTDAGPVAVYAYRRTATHDPYSTVLNAT